MKLRIKNSKFWIKLSHSQFYLKFRNPNFCKSYQEELNFYKTLFEKKPKLIFDVGANVGFKTQMFLEIAEKVISFEPSEKMLHILSARYDGNHRVKIINQALSSSNEDNVEFYDISGLETMSSLSTKHLETVVKNRNAATKDNIVSRKITTATLDKYIQEFGVPDYIKIDVEGFELEVIKGLSKVSPLVSVEANLPEFLDETVEVVKNYHNYPTMNILIM